MSHMFMSSHEVAKVIATSFREKRLSLNLSQKSLAERAGVSYAVLKKFEVSGKISLESLLKLSLVLGSLGEFMELFKEPLPETYPTLDDLLKDKSRKRGRK